MPELSSLDIKFLVGELQDLLGGKIRKVYQRDGEVHLIIYMAGQGSRTLVIGSGKFFLTNYKYEYPQKPLRFCMVLRKYLTGQRIEKIIQHDFERVVIIKTGDYQIIVELFGKGEVILTDAQGKIIDLPSVRKWKHRTLKKGECYSMPPPALNPFKLDADFLHGQIRESGKQVVAFLARELSMGGKYAEEVCLMSKLEKTKKCTELEKNEVERILKAVKKLSRQKISPYIVYENGKPLDFAPFGLMIYKGNENKKFGTFSETCDEFFITRTDAGSKKDIVKEPLKHREMQQEKTIKNLEEKQKEAEETAELMYNQYMVLDNLIKEIQKDVELSGWINVRKNLKKYKIIESMDLKNKSVCVNIGKQVVVELGKSIPENVETYYNKAKECKRKIRGAIEALERTRKEMEKKVKDVAVKLPEKKETGPKKWFEKFRWFESSEGFLCVGGRDATTNEILIKKHTDKDDIVFHADITGSPFVVVKTKGKKPGKKTIEETAQFTGSYSRAWSAGVGIVDVYWVTPEQVSKKAPSGEYISKGAFMIYGKKNRLKPELRLAFGFDGENVISGPIESVRKRCPKFVITGPGDMKSKQLAEKIKGRLMSMLKDKDREKLKQINIFDIQKFIPSGKGRLER